MSNDLFNFTEQSEVDGLSINGSKITKSVEITNECFVEAIQIVRIVKGLLSKSRREVITTITIDGAKMTYERAKRVAEHKAQLIGNCMVVEKLERVTSTH